MISTLPYYNEILVDIHNIVKKIADKRKIKCYGYWPHFDEIKETDTYIITGQHTIVNEFAGKHNDGYILRYTIHIFSRYKGYKKVNSIQNEILDNNIFNIEGVAYGELAGTDSIIEDGEVAHVVINLDYYILR